MKLDHPAEQRCPFRIGQVFQHATEEVSQPFRIIFDFREV
jgi:hypothetical protein